MSIPNTYKIGTQLIFTNSFVAFHFLWFEDITSVHEKDTKVLGGPSEIEDDLKLEYNLDSI